MLLGKIFKKPIVNTAVLGAFSAITNLVSLDSLKKAINENFARKGQKLADLNNQAIEEVYNDLKSKEAEWKKEQQSR